MGHIYENGLGVTADLVAARDYYQQSADQGYAQASDTLARLDGDVPSTNTGKTKTK